MSIIESKKSINSKKNHIFPLILNERYDSNTKKFNPFFKKKNL